MSASTQDCVGDGLHQVIFEDEHVRVLLVNLPPGMSTGFHQHIYDYVTVVVGPAEIEEQAADGASTRRKVERGAALGRAAGYRHNAINVGSTFFRNVVVEMKQK